MVKKGQFWAVISVVKKKGQFKKRQGSYYCGLKGAVLGSY